MSKLGCSCPARDGVRAKQDHALMTFVKICGLTNFADTEAALNAGADYLGFIFYEKSARKADPEAVARIMQAFDAQDRYRTLIGVGVFVGPSPEKVADAIRAVRPWAVDVAIGVEAAPGKKDHGKLKAFIEAVREADKEFIS